MSVAAIAGRVASCLLLASATAFAQSTYVLENTVARYEFQYDGITGEAWLHRGWLKSDPTRIATFARTSVWDCELRVNPNDIDGIDPARGEITEVASLISFSGPVSFGGGTGVRFTWRFTLDADPSLGEADPEVTLNSFWTLDTGSDVVRARAGFSLVAPATTSYRLWSLRFPRIAMHNLDASGNGADRLLTSIQGGLLHANPIRYVDPYDSLGRGFTFCRDNNPADGIINALDVEPGSRTVPLTYYYNPTFGGPNAPLGVYLANDDDQGYFKGLHIIPERTAAGAPMGLLHHETVVYPAQPGVSIFDTVTHQAQYNVLVGIVHGDWVDAARKYRDYRIHTTDLHLDGSVRFPWLKTDDQGTPDPSDDEIPRPSGHPQNPWIHEALKHSPYQARIEPGFGGGYCVGQIAFETLESEFRDFMEPFFLDPGETFPFLLLDRFQVTYDEVKYVGPGGAYAPRPSGVMDQVHHFIQDLSAEGHLVLMDSMTEKFWIMEHTREPCSNFTDCLEEDGSHYSWCCSIEDGTGADTQLRRLTWESRQHFDPTRIVNPNKLGYPCPRGRSANVGVEPTLCASDPHPGSPPWGTAWPPVFEDIVAQAIQFQDVQGGMRFNSVPSSATGCFSEEHDHPAGFGKECISGWFDVMQNIRTKAGRGHEFFVIKEYGDSTVAQQVRVQNPLCLDISEDVFNRQGADESEWNRFLDSNVARVPLLQMVADEIRYCSQYTKDTLNLGWTNLWWGRGRDLDGDSVPEPRYFFRRFPAVTGAFHCWSMSKRALIHQGGVLITNANLDSISRFLDAPVSNENRALQGMADYYRGLAGFLKGTGVDGKQNMEFVTGTMERAPLVRIVNADEQFAISRAVIDHPSKPFPNLSEYLSEDYGDGVTTFPPGLDLTFDTYRPLYEELFDLPGPLNAAIQGLPEEHESWLPHGMYRHWDGSDTLALFVANPWGVRHAMIPKVSKMPPPAGPLPSRPMNPFTFDFLDPLSSPTSNTYDYEFDFDPTDYDIGAATSYEVERRTYDLSGNAIATVSLGAFQGTHTFAGTLEEFHFQSFYFAVP